MEQPKLYYYMGNSHHYLISRINEKTYGLFDLATNRYTDERWKTLKEALKGVKKYTNNIEIFDTYRELLECMLKKEYDYDMIDLFGDKNLVERESLHNDKVKEIHKKMGV